MRTDRARPWQAWRPRTELPQRSRSGVPVRRRRDDDPRPTRHVDQQQPLLSELANGSSRPQRSSARTAGCTKSTHGSARPAAAATRCRCRRSSVTSARETGSCERLALCKSRIIVGSPEGAGHHRRRHRFGLSWCPWRAQDAAEIQEMRQRLRESASSQNLKRTTSGTMNAELVSRCCS